MNAQRIRQRMSGNRRRGSLENLVRSRVGTQVFGTRDCLSCYPAVIDRDDLPVYCEATLSGVGWSMPEASTGSVGPFSMYSRFGVERWQCPSWYSGVTCGTEVVDQAMLSWRLDTVNLDTVNGTKTGTRVNPNTNKCLWTWGQGRVLNSYFHGAITGRAASSGPFDNWISIAPDLRAETHDLIYDLATGVLTDSGTDNLNLCGVEVGRLFTYHDTSTGNKMETVGWRHCRRNYGVSWAVSVGFYAGRYHWRLTCFGTWLWSYTNTAKRKVGSISYYGTPVSMVGTYAGPIFGKNTPGLDDIAGTRSQDCSLIETRNCGTIDLDSLHGRAVTQELVQNLATTPASSPPGHRLYRASGASVNFPSSITFSYLSEGRSNCRDLFNGSEIALALQTGNSDLDLGYYGSTFGLSVPSSATLRFVPEAI